MYLIPFTHSAPEDTMYPELQEAPHSRWPACIRQWAYGRDLRSLGDSKEMFFRYKSGWLEEGFDGNALPYWRFNETGKESCRSLLKKFHQAIWKSFVIEGEDLLWHPRNTTPDKVCAVMDELFGL
jgi:hypothetical protein